MYDLYTYVSVDVKACKANARLSLALLRVSKPILPHFIGTSLKWRGKGVWELVVNRLFVSTLFHRFYVFISLYE